MKHEDIVKAEKFANDFIANNPPMFKTFEDEKLAKDILKRTYLAGRNKHTYVEMGCAGNYEEIYEEKQSN